MKTYALTIITALTLGMLVSGLEAGCKNGRCGRRRTRTTAATKVATQKCTKKQNCPCTQCKAKRAKKPACKACRRK